MAKKYQNGNYKEVKKEVKKLEEVLQVERGYYWGRQEVVHIKVRKDTGAKQTEEIKNIVEALSNGYLKAAIYESKY